jgi:excinuclease ABC subunit A
MTVLTKSKDLIIRGARENNLKNIDVAIPREQLVVITGLSGSGKSSLAFETIYAEGQRRFLESLSAYARRRVEQLKKPDVDFVYGLSPVVSIEQKTVSRNPRSTVGTVTDIYDFVRLLYATAGRAHCPVCRDEIPIRTAHQIAEHLLALPEGTVVEICAPIHKIYGEDFSYLFGEIRTRGYRRLYVDDELRDISEELELDEGRAFRLEVLIDRFTVKHQRPERPGAGRRDLRDDILKQVVVSAQSGLRLGEGFLRFRLAPPEGASLDMASFCADFCCPEHLTVMGELQSYYFAFNDPDSACPTCGGLGTYMKVHPELLVPRREQSIREGCFVPEAFSYDRNTWPTKIMVSVAAHYGFSLDTPWGELPPEVVEIVLYGTRGERFPIVMPPGATRGAEHAGRLFRFDGIINEIERRYKHYRRQQVAHTHMETYLRKVMAEHLCPDCGGTKLKPQRLLVTIKGVNIHQFGEMPLSELRAFLEEVPFSERNRGAGEQVRKEIAGRLDLLLGIGVDYLSLNRRSMTLSGGESQRIRLSTQIGSGLMGMLYVLDEPSIGLHPKDNIKMIHTLQRLRDIGNSVIVVEHDEETIRAADHILEIGPGPGVHGGTVVAQGSIAEIEGHPESLTGAYLRGSRSIPLPERRRPLPPHPQMAGVSQSEAGTLARSQGGVEELCSSTNHILPPRVRRGGRGRGEARSPNRGWITIRGASENNLRNIDVPVPLGVLVCVTGASGSGKSSLVNEILYKRLHHLLHDTRTLYGAHQAIDGVEQISDVIDIDQTPIGRSPRSNPATYIGFYDDIRRLFAATPEAERRGYGAGHFSFNTKGGRCEECAGEGIVVTSLHFMPDVENPCPACKGARYKEATLEVEYRGKNIAEILAMPVEEGVTFFHDQRLIAHKLGMLAALGLGYLRLGQSSTTLSGGEAQRIKLAGELGKVKRGAHNLYILDEPTTGLHLADIQRLLDSLNRLVDAGHTVLVIEHHLDVIKTADYVIDLGPEGGHAGGELVVAGTPEEVAACERSHTGRYLRHYL